MSSLEFVLFLFFRTNKIVYCTSGDCLLSYTKAAIRGGGFNQPREHVSLEITINTHSFVRQGAADLISPRLFKRNIDYLTYILYVYKTINLRKTSCWLYYLNTNLSFKRTKIPARHTEPCLTGSKRSDCLWQPNFGLN